MLVDVLTETIQDYESLSNKKIRGNVGCISVSHLGRMESLLEK